MLTEVNEYLQTAPFLALIPGTAIVLCSWLQPDRRRSARGSGSQLRDR